MTVHDDERLFGNTARAFVFERPALQQYFVRPGVMVVDGNQIQFRNFAQHPVRIDAAFLVGGGVNLAAHGAPGASATRSLVANPPLGFQEYSVTVQVPGKPVEAIGDSRPGAIIDR